MSAEDQLANEVLSYFPDGITAYKLQKLMYYAHAVSLVDNGAPLARFEAFENGPVCRAIFKRFQGRWKVWARAEADTFPPQSEAADAVRKAIAMYGHYTPEQLVDLTHSERPWIEAAPDEGPISDESIRSFYSKVYAEEADWLAAIHLDPRRGMTTHELSTKYLHHLR